jgi:hypothetical protein
LDASDCLHYAANGEASAVISPDVAAFIARGVAIVAGGELAAAVA